MSYHSWITTTRTNRIWLEIELERINQSMPGADVYRSEGGTLLMGSTFVDLSKPFKPHFTISAEEIQKYLEKVVISTVALESSPQIEVSMLEGAKMFVFQAPGQFYGLYAACLIITLAIYILGIRDMRFNGTSAGNSFVQWVSTTRASDMLHKTAQRCSPGGQENFKREFETLELRFGLRKDRGEIGDGQPILIAGFGCQDEVDPFYNV